MPYYQVQKEENWLMLLATVLSLTSLMSNPHPEIQNMKAITLLHACSSPILLVCTYC